MKSILKEDVSKIIPCIEKVIEGLGNGSLKTEFENTLTVGEDISIANVKGYWVKDIIRIDIKFR
jgi:hypothetical protein